MINSESIYCFGSNFSGQLGIGDKVREVPPYCPYPFGNFKENNIEAKDIQDIQCGAQFTLMLATSGQVTAKITVEMIY
jgi:alpha-tubulin suppressor-like RCC1 family protein